jgi:hypothetical protein
VPLNRAKPSRSHGILLVNDAAILLEIMKSHSQKQSALSIAAAVISESVPY